MYVTLVSTCLTTQQVVMKVGMKDKKWNEERQVVIRSIIYVGISNINEIRYGTRKL